MKTFAALVFGLSAVGALSAAAVAEPFNDRSPQPPVYKSAAMTAAPQAVVVESDRFNDRGIDYTAARPVEPGTLYTAVLADHTHFNMK